MKFERPLIKATILKRYKRFLADCELNSGEIITAHTANTGSMKTCWEPGWEVALSESDNPKRKLKYSLEMTNNGETWIGINTSLPNAIVYEAIESQHIAELQGYQQLKREVKRGKSRIDIFASSHNSQADCFIEVKNVTLKGDGELALFPDAVSERGQKHLQELIQIVKVDKLRAVIFFLVQREDVSCFSPAAEIDPTYAKLLKQAVDAGVEALVYQCEVNPKEIKIKQALELKL